jgi:hypothetical protein
MAIMRTASALPLSLCRRSRQNLRIRVNDACVRNEEQIDVFLYLFGLVPTCIRLCRRRLLVI